MKSVGEGRRLYQRLTIGLLVAAGAYSWYVTVQYGRLNDLNQRELANASAELKRAIQNSVETVSQLRRLVASDAGPAAAAKSPAREADLRPWRLCSFDADQPYLAMAPPSDCERVIAGIKDVKVTPTPPLGIQVQVEEITDLKQRTALGTPVVRFAFETGALLRELSFPDSFGLIFIADAKEGAVLYQDAPTKRAWLRHLRWGEQQFRDSGANIAGSLNIQELQSALGADKDTGWPRLHSMSARTSTRLGGQLHEVYLEPMVLENGETVPLVLGGAVPTEMIVRQALAVDSYFLAALVFLMLLFVLGFPFIKLLSLDAHERFTLRDVTRLYLSTAALLALFTFAALAVDGYVSWHETANSGLQQLARRLEKDFVEEIGQVHKTLIDFDRQVSAHASDDLRTMPLAVDWYGADSESQELRLAPPTDPIHIEQVAWIDPTGRQVWKTTADAVTTRTPVPGRVYFRSVRDGYLFTGDATGEPFYIGPEKSITDGKFYTFVSMPSRVTSGKGERGYVAAATARLFSLDNVPLPAGYGFVVINREGRVLYHSDARLSLRENLFDELGDGVRARGLVYAGREEGLTTAYRERPHELYIRPLPLTRSSDGSPAGFALITFRDTSLERTVAARVFLIALLGPMLLLLVFVAVAMLAVAIVTGSRREHWSVWLWPHGGLEPMYRKASLFLAVLLVASLAAWWTGESELVFVATPILAVSISIGLYAIATRTRPVRQPLTSSTWIVTVFMLLLACSVIVPASALFGVAMAHEFGKLVSTEQEWVAAQRDDLPAKARAATLAEGRTVGMAQHIADERGRLMNARPLAVAPFDATLAPTHQAADWLLRPFHWADDYLPIGSYQAARQRFEERELSYASGRHTPWGLAMLVATAGILWWWIRWKVRAVYFADQPTVEPTGESPETRWANCSPDERCVLFQIARYRVANPYQRVLVLRLLGRGLLTLDPSLRPSPPAFADYVREREGELHDELRAWEKSESDHSWRYVRLALLTALTGLGVFIVATQPGMQSGLLGIATALTGGLTAVVKLREAFGSWIGSRKADAA